MDYPIFAILGRRGSGKTLHMTYLATQYINEGFKVVSNVAFKGFKYHYIEYEQLIYDLLSMDDFPDYLREAVLFFDELQLVADSYNFNSKETRALTKLVTQIRKLKSTMYWSTQVFTMVTKRVRDQTNFITQVLPSTTKGVSKVTVYDYMGHENGLKVKQFLFDGRPYFNKYDTNHIISYNPNDKRFKALEDDDDDTQDY